MRIQLWIGSVSVAVLAACGSGSGDGNGNGNGNGNGSVDGGGSSDDGGGQTANGFSIETPPILIEAGTEATYCYHTTLPTDAAVAVKKWSSTMTSGSHHMIMYFTDTLAYPEGTINTTCGFGNVSATNVPVWTYSAQTPEAEFPMPEGVGMAVAAGQPAQIEMHYLNAGDTDLMANVTIEAEVFEEGAEFEQASVYFTYNTEIEVDPGQEGSAEGNCDVPPAAKFFTMSTHSHKFSTRTEVYDGEELLVESENWEHPEVAEWVDSPYSFSGPLRYRCEYFNDSEQIVREGDSAETDEMCMAVGYFYPSSGPIACLNNTVIPF